MAQQQQDAEENPPRRCVVVLGSAANPPHRGHLHCLKLGKHKAESLGYQVLTTSIAIAPHGYVKQKMTKDAPQSALVLSDASRLRILELITQGNNAVAQFHCPDRAYGSALELGKSIRPDDSVAIVIVKGGDRGKNKWRKEPKAQHGAILTVCCARDQEQWQTLQKLFAKDQCEGLVKDQNFHLALEVGPPTSSTMIRFILLQEGSSEEGKVALLADHRYSGEAARYMLSQVPVDSIG
ncbi:expressed unknown protein [Seminavis robusta]|uniref:Cytidyltransferase-like domain-containing protein n=1 Tax=Seminavis robusta TaxID=568900 RepID=A0A9N8HFL1_9STRA|nr:expressed unknown protein [Seminavis robusta]|eukprot:Sro440_g143400.1 n/a (238) ;mRNA; f:19607-20320